MTLVPPSPFPIATPRELLSKAKRELDRLEADAGGSFGEPDATSIADLTINTAWSLWHVTDWIGNNADSAVSRIVPERIKKTGIERTQRFQHQLCSESDDLAICYALALRFKHFELEAQSRARDVLGDDDTHVSTKPAFKSRVVGMVDQGSEMPVGFSLSAVVRAIEPSMATLHPKVHHDGESKRLVDVYRRAYEFLDRLLNKHGL